MATRRPRQPGNTPKRRTPRAKTGDNASVKKVTTKKARTKKPQRPSRKHYDTQRLVEHSHQVQQLASRRVVIGKNKKNTMSVGLIVAMIALLVIFVAPPTFTYISTYQEVRHLRYEVAQAKERRDELRDEVARWDDKKFVESQARERLGFVTPGQTRYRVVDPDPQYLERHSKKHDETPPRPWFIQAQESIAKAGTADAKQTDMTTHRGKPAEGATVTPKE